jgi:hypothetical protein
MLRATMLSAALVAIGALTVKAQQSEPQYYYEDGNNGQTALQRLRTTIFGELPASSPQKPRPKPRTANGTTIKGMTANRSAAAAPAQPQQQQQTQQIQQPQQAQQPQYRTAAAQPKRTTAPATTPSASRKVAQQPPQR